MERVRVRYKKTKEDGVLQSAKSFLHPNNGAKYRVVLNTTRLEYAVVDDIVDEVAASGAANSLQGLKIKARSALAELGVSLPKEERTKRATE